MKGVMEASNVKIYSVTATGENDTELASAFTASDGTWSADPAACDDAGVYRVEVTQGTYKSEATQATVTNTVKYSAIVDMNSPEVSSAAESLAITPISTFIDSRAVKSLSAKPAVQKALFAPTSLSAAISDATTKVKEHFGFTSNPMVLKVNFDKKDEVTSNPDGTKLGLILGAFTQQAADQNLADPGVLLEALAKDFSDGAFDGKEGTVEITYQVDGTTAVLAPDTGTTGVTTAITNYIQNPNSTFQESGMKEEDVTTVVIDIKDSVTTSPAVKSEDVTAINAEAYAFLEAEKYTDANLKYKEALAKNPLDRTANFGVAFTNLVDLMNNTTVTNMVNSFASDPVNNPILDPRTTIQIIDIVNLFANSGTTIMKPTKRNSGIANLTGLLVKLKESLPKDKPAMVESAQKFASTIPATAYKISQIQSIVETDILPVVESSLRQLRVVENTGYTFTTPPCCGTTPDPSVVLDDGEFLLADAALSVVKGVLLVATAYNLEIDYAIVEADPMSIFNGAHASWSVDPMPTLVTIDNTIDASNNFTLKTTGKTKMSSAISALRAAVDNFEKALVFIKAETPAQAAEGAIKWADIKPTSPDPNNPDPAQEAEDEANMWKLIDMVQLALSGQVKFTNKYDPADSVTLYCDNTITVASSTTSLSIISVDAEWDAGCNRTESFDVNISQLGVTPVERTNLPTFNYRGTYNVYDSWVFNQPMCSYTDPNFTEVCFNDNIVWPANDKFNGLFPNGVPADWK
ncbi:MAG: hypothetical protein OEY64_10425 [Nitrospinota bacterium]|nr:hypothetical protein [Nitrospinota bacterium]